MIREFQFSCPECEGWIVIDLDSGEILKHGKKGQPRGEPAPKKFDDAFARFKERAETPQDPFDNAVKSVEKAKKQLERAFEDAQEKARQNPDEKPHRPFDDLFS